MNIKTGIDIVYLPRFRKALKNGGQNFLKRVYLPEELKNTRIARLAGIFAAKEAVIKALDLPIDAWHEVEVINRTNGAPQAKIRNSKHEIRNCSLSVSHDGNYIIAQFVALIKKS